MKRLSTAVVRSPKIVLKVVLPAMCATALLTWFLPDVPALAQKAPFPPPNLPDPGGPQGGMQPGVAPGQQGGPPGSQRMAPGTPGGMTAQPQMGGPRMPPGAPGGTMGQPQMSGPRGPGAPGPMGQPPMGGSSVAPGTPPGPGQSPMGPASIRSGQVQPMPQAQPQVQPGAAGQSPMRGPGGMATPQGGMQPGPARRPTQ